VNLLIRGGRVIDPAESLDETADVLIVAGKVEAVGRNLSAPDGAPVIEAGGMIVCPGLIDMHVHLREPGHEYKETIASGTRAAAAGGFTAVACMPNTDPVNDDQAVTRYILEKAATEGLVRVYPIAAVSLEQKGEQLTEAWDLKAAGAVALSDDGRPVEDAGLMRRAMEYAHQAGLALISHSEDTSLSAHGAMNEGVISTHLGLRGIPAAAEEIMVYREISLARLTGCPVHIAHVSTAGSVDLVRRAKDDGLPVTAETCPHYFTLTEHAVLGFDTHAKMNPPLRTSRDLTALKKGLAEGVLDVIATDHAPHSVLEKEVEFDAAAFGIIGLETALALTQRLVREGVLDPTGAVTAMSLNPARILGVPGGTLKPGSPGDVTVLDTNRAWVVDSSRFQSLSRNTPFEGWRLMGQAAYTIVGGRVVWPPADDPA
jgi:dihydroorotase